MMMVGSGRSIWLDRINKRERRRENEKEEIRWWWEKTI